MTSNQSASSTSRRDLLKVGTAAAATVGISALFGTDASALAAEAEQDDELKEALQKLIDKDAILAKLSTYQRALDRFDDELAEQIFWEDSRMVSGSMEWTGPEFMAYCIAGREKNFSNTVGWAHHIVNTLVEVNGDKAGSESFGMPYFLKVEDENAEGYGNLYLESIRYNCKWEKRDGEWRMIECIVSDDGHAVIPDVINHTTGAHSAGDKTDPSYDALSYGM